MKALTAAAFAAAIGMVALSTTSASARIACNAEGDCWHVRGGWDFRPEHGVIIHPDNWKWAAGEHFRWHEHGGRGYWRGGRWVGF